MSKYLIVEIQHESWLNQDGLWYPVSRYPDNEDGRSAAASDRAKFTSGYSRVKFSEDGKKSTTEYRCVRIRETDD